jgi:hypothetical protein
MRHPTFLLAALLLAACSHTRGVSPALDVTESASDVNVYVTNHWELPMEIFAVGAGTTHRLGLVHPNTSRSFVLPQIVVDAGLVVFRAAPSADGRYVESEELHIRPGHAIDFEIATNLFGSRATIRM